MLSMTVYDIKGHIQELNHIYIYIERGVERVQKSTISSIKYKIYFISFKSMFINADGEITWI